MYQAPRLSRLAIASIIVLLLTALFAAAPLSADNTPPADQLRPVDPNTVVTSDGASYSSAPVHRNRKAELNFAGVDAAGDPAALAPDLAEEPLAPGVSGPYPSSVIGSDGRTKVSSTTTYPFRAIAYLYITFPNGNAGTCTGWFYGPRIVATAGHCVYDSGAGGWAKSITVYPGRNGSSVPYGSTTAYRLFSVTGWTSSRDPNYDYGSIQTNKDLGNTVGWFGFWWQSSNTFSQTFTVTGYPGDKPTATMWTMSGPIKAVTTYRLWYEIDTYGGQSGSPLYTNYSSSCNPCSAGYHTYGTGLSPYTQYNSATRITQSVYNNMVNWKNYAYP